MFGSAFKNDVDTVIFIDPSPSSVALKEGVDEDSSLGFVSVVNVRFPSPLLSEEEDIVVFVTVEDEEEEDEEESDNESLNGHGSSKGSQTEITPLK